MLTAAGCAVQKVERLSRRNCDLVSPPPQKESPSNPQYSRTQTPARPTPENRHEGNSNKRAKEKEAHQGTTRYQLRSDMNRMAAQGFGRTLNPDGSVYLGN